MDLESQGHDSKLMLFFILPGVKKLLSGPVTTFGFTSKPDDIVPFRSGPKPEARNHLRYAFRKTPFYSHGRKRYLALTLDLASGIMKIKTSHSLPNDEHLNIELVLGQKSFCLKGRIIYGWFLSDWGHISGIQFIEVSEEDRNSL